MLGDSGHAAGGVNRHALHQASDYLRPLSGHRDAFPLSEPHTDQVGRFCSLRRRLIYA